jgi:diguanylate cyclase (GGDEF)-like protein/PAS domain S-box-containing protein
MSRWGAKLVLPLILLVVTGLAAYSGFRADRNAERQSANAASVRSVSAVQSLTDGLSDRIKDEAGLFEANKHVTARTFRLFTAPIVRTSEASGIGWAVVVRGKDRAAFERKHHFKIAMQDPSGKRVVAPKSGRYVVAVYFLIRGQSAAAEGGDIESNVVRHKALIASTAAGKPVATPPVFLDAHTFGISLYMPVYGRYSGGSRSSEPVGFVLGAFRFSDIATTLKQRLAGTPGLALGFKGQSLVKIGPRKGGATTVTRNLDVAGQTFVVRSWVPKGSYPLGWIFLVAGLLLTILVTLVTNLLLRANRGARQLAEARAHEQELMLAMQERKSEAAEERFTQVFDSATVGMALSDLNGRYAKVNKAFCDLVGRDEAELIGMRPREITHPDDIALAEQNIEEMFRGKQTEFEQDKRYIGRDGNIIWVAMRVKALLDPDGKPEMILVQTLDISERQKQKESLRHMADHDGLTGLPNRRAFSATLGQQLSLARRYGPDGALFLLDLDNFKAVNDVHGHSTGDVVLRRVAEVVREQLRDSDYAGRIGGDEFSVVVPKGSVADVAVLAERLVQAIAKMGREHPHDGVADITCSIGVAMLLPETTSVNAISEQADAAMYAAKAKGRNCFVVSAEGMAEATGAPKS